jgi:hypothetical protein
MIKKVVLSITVLIALAIIALLFIGAPYVATPTFRVENISAIPVLVTARWRERQKEIGEVKAGDIVLFELNDEAAMSFDIKYPNGKTESTTPMYFTSGTTIYVQINDKGIDVSAGT